MKNILSIGLIMVIFFLIPIAAQKASAQKFDRGIVNQVFVPKGQWFVGGAFSYLQTSTDDYSVIVLDNVDTNGYTLNINPFAGYFIKDNMAVGLRFGYKRTNTNIDNLDFDLIEDLDFNINGFSSLSHVYYGTAMMRNYLNLGRTRRFGLFSEVRLTLGGGQGKTISGSGDNFTGTYQDIFEFQLGVSPGLTAFVTNTIAVEATVGVMGLEYKKVKQTKDQIYQGEYNRSGLNFRFNILSIGLGLTFYM